MQINDTVSDCFLKFGLLRYVICDNKFILSSLTIISFEYHLQSQNNLNNLIAMFY